MLISATALVLALMGQSASGNAGRVDEQRRLEACIAKLDEAPEEAYEDGLAWVAEGGRPFARQCTALALVELGHAAEGASRLEELANADNGGSIEQRSIYLTQAGNAWILAGAFEAAIVTLDNAIRLNQNDPNLYADRAAAMMELERWDEAALDLDYAISNLYPDIALHKMRAETRLNLDELVGAQEDVTAALELEPTDIQTLVLRGRVREAIRVAEEEASDTPLLLIGDE